MKRSDNCSLWSSLTHVTGYITRVFVAVGLFSGVAQADQAKASNGNTPSVIQAQNNESVRNELQHAIDRGLVCLATNENSNGWWQTSDHPAVTGLALIAFNGDPMDRYRGKAPAYLKQAYRFVLSEAKPDGSICVTNLPTYNTAICMMALLSANDSQYDPILRKARAFLIGAQNDFGEKGKLDTPFDGGFGYGLPSDRVSDMSNTLVALEAMYYSRHLAADQSLMGAKDLNWQAAIHFLQSCQNLPSHNDQPWVSGADSNKGGFIYHSGRSNAGGETNAATGRIALRSYGSMSYAGLLTATFTPTSGGMIHG